MCSIDILMVETKPNCVRICSLDSTIGLMSTPNKRNAIDGLISLIIILRNSCQKIKKKEKVLRKFGYKSWWLSKMVQWARSRAGVLMQPYEPRKEGDRSRDSKACGAITRKNWFTNKYWIKWSIRKKNVTSKKGIIWKEMVNTHIF